MPRAWPRPKQFSKQPKEAVGTRWKVCSGRYAQNRTNLLSEPVKSNRQLTAGSAPFRSEVHINRALMRIHATPFGSDRQDLKAQRPTNDLRRGTRSNADVLRTDRSQRGQRSSARLAAASRRASDGQCAARSRNSTRIAVSLRTFAAAEIRFEFTQRAPVPTDKSRSSANGKCASLQEPTTGDVSLTDRESDGRRSSVLIAAASRRPPAHRAAQLNKQHASRSFAPELCINGDLI